jgi:hypothetical protein
VKVPGIRSSPALSPGYATDLATLTLEAMRLGVVPATEIAAYTVGRQRELALIDADLAEADARGGSVRAFLGDYGTGKTHLLELGLQRALARNFLAAHVTLDALETSPSHPKRVYRALLRSLRYPEHPFEEGAGLEPLLERAAGSAKALKLFGVEPRAAGGTLDERLAAGQHLYLSAAVAYTRTLGRDHGAERLRGVTPTEAPAFLARCSDLLTDWIEGHPTISNQVIDSWLSRLPGRHPRVYSLIDYRPWARIYGYLLSGIAALARVAGYRGLVVLLDEAEFYALLSRENRSFASQLFKAWTFAALGGREPEEEGGDALPFDASVIEIGGYGIQQRLPGRYGTHPGLCVVFAMTPSPDGVEALGGAVPADRIHTLTPFELGDYERLAATVCDFYASSRPDWALPERLVEPLGRVLAGLIGAGHVSNPRQAMKFIVEFLDIVRFDPRQVLAVIRQLQEQLAW